MELIYVISFNLHNNLARGLLFLYPFLQVTKLRLKKMSSAWYDIAVELGFKPGSVSFGAILSDNRVTLGTVLITCKHEITSSHHYLLL